ncbi:MAG: 30S ribosomal protein S16 [Chloroflexota bacterium]
MVRIRLRRVGAKKQPSYRVVAADKESPRDGRFLENLGIYNPRTEPSTIQFEEARVYYWLSVGAQPSDSVSKLFKQVGLTERYERFKAGEDVAVLEAEAAAVLEARNVDPRTRRDDLKSAAPKKAEEPAEELAEEPVEEVAEESTEEPAEELAEEPVEDAAEESTEESTEEPAEESSESEESEA